MDNEQTKLWRGDFGDQYLKRNQPSSKRVNNQTIFWSKIFNILKKTDNEPKSILEVGANVGINLRAIRNICSAEIYAIEPNEKARNILIDDNVVKKENLYAATGESMPFADSSIDLVFTAGVLIHVNPNTLDQVMSEIHRVSKNTIICAEYFNAYPEMIEYRGMTNKLFKRDFGGSYLDNIPSLKLLDYGFEWKRVSGLDNITWWVFKK